MDIEAIQAFLSKKSAENDRMFFTDPDAVLYLLSLRGMSLKELSEAANIPIWTIIYLPSRSIMLSRANVDAIAVALGAGYADFASQDVLVEPAPVVKYDLLERLGRRLKAGARKKRELELTLG